MNIVILSTLSLGSFFLLLSVGQLVLRVIDYVFSNAPVNYKRTAVIMTTLSVIAVITVFLQIIGGIV